MVWSAGSRRGCASKLTRTAGAEAINLLACLWSIANLPAEGLTQLCVRTSHTMILMPGNEGLAGAQQRHPTERIAAYNETEHGVVTLLNIANCNLDCLDHDAFAFAGASTVTTVDVHGNNFAELPEALLSNLSSLRIFNGDRLAKLSSLPPRLFRGHSQLQELSFKSCSNLGNGGQGLPGGLLQGLTSLAKLAFSYSPIKSLPSLDDLKVCTVLTVACPFSLPWWAARWVSRHRARQ